MQLEYRPDTKVFPRAKLMGRMKLGNFFALPENDFNEYIKEVEQENIFQDLLNEYRVVRYRKFPGIKEGSSSVEFKEELTPAGNFDFTDIAQQDPQAWQVVRKVALGVGEEKFSRLLRGDEQVSFRSLPEKCGLSPEQMRKFKEFLDYFQLQQSFFATEVSTGSSFSRSSFFKVACIDNENGKLSIAPVDNSTYLVKGRYVIDYEKWETLVRDKRISQDRARKISTIFRKLDMINKRTTTLYQILCEIKKRQRDFLLSGAPQHMVSLTQLEVAESLEVNPSTISRAIDRKSIITPWGGERAIKDFFCGQKEKTKSLLVEVIEEEKKRLKEGTLARPLSDEKIKNKLKKLFEIKIARRTVTKYRRELKIPSSKKRKLRSRLA